MLNNISSLSGIIAHLNATQLVSQQGKKKSKDNVIIKNSDYSFVAYKINP